MCMYVCVYPCTEGYYRVKPSLEYGVARARAFAPYCDLLWMETAVPNVDDARAFAEGVHAEHPVRRCRLTSG